MAEDYQIYNVEVKDKSLIEQMGTKSKFWTVESSTGERWLFKYNRPDTGEDWSEKIACEVAELIGLPHAIVELAKCEGNRGIISKDFTERRSKGNLVHGNEILAELVPGYPTKQYWGVSQHSVSNIIAFLSKSFVKVPQNWKQPAGIKNAIDLFSGYLMLDALIGNTDRHHENWGVLVRPVESTNSWRIELAPTFDHASSLSRELTDGKREKLLLGTDWMSNVERYAIRAVSAIYLRTEDAKPLSTLDAFMVFSSHVPEARKVWLDKLTDIGEDLLNRCVNRVPDECLSGKSSEFISSLLSVNRKRLLSLVETGK